ncbi:MAG: hypothetical protein U5J63_04855 [Fodinibius sp.]|nr:hypothetical protein [Fodinibius sp.]
MMTFLIFGLGYAVFAPLGGYQIYRLYVMGALIIAISLYLWRNMDMLVVAFESTFCRRSGPMLTSDSPSQTTEKQLIMRSLKKSLLLT